MLSKDNRRNLDFVFEDDIKKIMLKGHSMDNAILAYKESGRDFEKAVNMLYEAELITNKMAN